MSIVEIIGFVISLLALIFLFFQNKGRGPSEPDPLHPFNEEEEGLADDPLRQLLKQLDQEMHPKKKEPPPAPKKKQLPPKAVQRTTETSLSRLEGHRLQSSVENRKFKSAIEERHLKSNIANRKLQTRLSAVTKDLDRQRNKETRLAVLLRQMPHLSHLIIYNTILDKPKSLKAPDQW